MAPVYNMTQLAKVKSLSSLMTYANSATNNILFGLFIVAIFFVMLLILKKWEFVKSFTSSSFACFVLSAVLFYGGYLHFMFALLFLIFTAFGGLFLYASSRS